MTIKTPTVKSEPSMTKNEIIRGSIFILIFAVILIVVILKHKHEDNNYYFEIPKHNILNKNDTETIMRLENILVKLQQEVESGRINIELLSAQKKLVETHLKALKSQ